MPTLGDVFRCYVKPTLDGLLVIRKRNVIRKSKKVMAINKKLEDAVAAGKAPAKLAREECIRHKGWYYIGKDGKKHCHIKHFIKLLRKYMRETITGASASAE